MISYNRHRLTLLLFIVLTALFYQNCNRGGQTHPNDPTISDQGQIGSPPSNGNPGTGGPGATQAVQDNGHPYEGKLYGRTGGNCSDNNPYQAIIEYLGPTSALLIRDNCQEMSDPIILTALDFHLDPLNAGLLIYKGHIFIAIPPGPVPGN